MLATRFSHGQLGLRQLRAQRIGLVSMAGSGFIANFDYVRVYRVAN